MANSKDTSGNIVGLTHIQIDANDKFVNKYSDLVDSSYFLKLETSSESSIGIIDKILFDDDKIFIEDKNISKAIFVFNDKGRFISKIASQGKAPGEFIDIRDFTLDTTNKHICLVDLSGRKINFYNYNGLFQFSKQLPFLLSSFAYLDPETIAISTNGAYNKQANEVDNYDLIISDTGGIVKNKFFHFEEKLRQFTYFNTQHLRSFNSKIFFYPRYSDTIFRIIGKSVKPIYAFDFKSDGISQKEKENMNDEKFRSLIQERSYFGGDYVELDDFAYFIVNTPKGNLKVFHSKKTQKNIHGLAYIIDKPLQSFIDVPVASYKENTFVVTYPAIHVLNIKATLFLNNAKNKDVQDLYDKLDVNSNPILFFHKMKEF